MPKFIKQYKLASAIVSGIIALLLWFALFEPVWAQFTPEPFFPTIWKLLSSEESDLIYWVGVSILLVLVVANLSLVIFAVRGFGSQQSSAKPETSAKLETATAKLNTVIKSLLKKEAEIDRLSSELVSVKEQWGKWRIRFIGINPTPRNLSVAVQFIALEDNELAERIRWWFVDMALEPVWKPASEIEQIKWRRNPSKSKVVIFSNIRESDGLKAAFDDCELIPAEVAVCPKEVEMLADLTIVVFPSDGSTH